MRTQYWQAMKQATFEYIYIGKYYDLSVRYDRNINIFLAVVSGGGIAGWAVWQEFAFVWAVLIAASQVINAVKPLLPYEKRIKELLAFQVDLKEMQLKLKHEWLRVDKGELSDAEINKLISDYEDERLSIAKGYLVSDSLGTNQILKTESDKETDEYLKIVFYGGE